MSQLSQPQRPAIFLDRDGVINVDHGHVYRQEDFELVPGILELIARANAAGWLVVVVTNQAGIAKYYYTEADFQRLMQWVKTEFAAQGAVIDAVYHCPHHPDFGALAGQDCGCRKPQPGMLVQAAADLGIDLAHSVLIGDKQTDLDAAASAGVPRAYLFESGNVDAFAQRHFDFLPLDRPAFPE